MILNQYRYLRSVADPECLARIPDQNFFHPGSASKNLSILTPKIVSKLSEIQYDPGSSSRIRIPDLGSRIQGSKRHRVRIRNSAGTVTPGPTYLTPNVVDRLIKSLNIKIPGSSFKSKYT